MSDPVSWLLGLSAFLLFSIVIGHVLVALLLIIPTWRCSTSCR